MVGSPPLDKKACYAAFRAHDARFDGRVFVCVSSTGIYCRPVCRVRAPREENCTFQPSAAAAEAAGYRPCLKCRPELAPGHAPVDAAARLARTAASRIDRDLLCDGDLAGLARELGVTDRHLRRVFAGAFGVSPVEYLQTRRLLLAKNLLTDTGLGVTEIAMAAGFGSIRRFNALFRKRYRMSPTDLRKSGGGRDPEGREGMTLLIGYRPPYGWDALLSFLAGRAMPGVESVVGGEYRRTVAVPDRDGTIRTGWIAVRNAGKRNALEATVAYSLLPVLPGVLARIRHLFDTDCDPVGIYETLSGMNAVFPGICVPGTRLPGCFDGFEMAVRAILGQWITVKAARTLVARVARAFGDPVAAPFAELTHTFPSPGVLAELPGPIEEHLGPLGVTGARARSIRALAEAMLADAVDLSPAADAETRMRGLLALPGFGPWTVQYLAMRALAWPDAFPHTDYGVKKAMGDRSEKDILRLAEGWRPWRSYATVNLWNSLPG